MCGRFVQKLEPEKLVAEYEVNVPADVHLRPRYNLAPTQPAALIVADERGGSRLEFASWGLVPGWAKDTSLAAKMINARVETLWEKPSYRDPLRYRRCLVPANGFYEWRQEADANTKTPFYFSGESDWLSFAGLWDVWNDKSGGELFTFTIITRPANRSMHAFHHRMPLILRGDEERRWLDHRLYRADDLRSILQSGDVALRSHAVSNRVNRVANDDADCVVPVPERRQMDLFG